MLIEVAKVGDVPEGEARRFLVQDTMVAVANLGEGRFYAVDDICSHAYASLAEGEVDADFETIECPRHGSLFDLTTGRPRSLPATAPVSTYPVKLEGDAILIEVEDET